MIGKGKSISHTKASMAYGWNHEKDAKIVFRKNLLGESPLELTSEFKLTQQLNHTCKKNTLSFVLSPTIEDGKKLTNKDLSKITNSFIKEMKLGDRQAIAFVHNDKEHKHIHCYINRIDFNGSAYNDSYIGKRCQKAAYRVAKLYELTTVKDIQEQNLESSKEIRKEIKLKHQDVLLNKKPQNFEEYIDEMCQSGVKVIPSINKQKEIQGFRFQYKQFDFKGSEVHRSMSYKKIKAEVSYQLEEELPHNIHLKNQTKSKQNRNQINI